LYNTPSKAYKVNSSLKCNKLELTNDIGDGFKKIGEKIEELQKKLSRNGLMVRQKD